MSLLNFNESEPKRSGEKKSLAILVGIGALVGVIALGSTLAASINLNGGAPVEFGQGVAQTTACDGDVTVTPFSTFVNDEENADFVFTSFSVTGISNACNGKTFTIKAYHDGDNSPLDLYITGGMTTYNSINVVGNNGNYSFVDAGLLSDDIEDVSTGFKVTMVTAGPPPSVALASAQDVDRITIESSGASEGLIDTAPAAQTCGPTPNGAPRYYPCGPQNNVAKSVVTGGSWQQCWEGTYADSVSFSQIQSDCSGDYVLYTGWSNSDPNNLLVLAAAPTSDVFQQTSRSYFDGPVNGGTNVWINNSTLSNGTYWYFTPGSSIGFSPNNRINQDPCDASYSHDGSNIDGSYFTNAAGIDSSVTNKRLCWHTYSGATVDPGWMLAGMDIGGASNYTRAIYNYIF